MLSVLRCDKDVGTYLYRVTRSEHNIKNIWTDIILKNKKHSGHQISSSAEGNNAEGPSINPTWELEGSLRSGSVSTALTPASRSGLRPVSRNAQLSTRWVWRCI